MWIYLFILIRATAYFGLRLLEPKKGDVFVVNGAAGAVGSIIGQLAKIQVNNFFLILEKN